ncbi:MAG: hypothetical protein OEV00_03480 [Acidobacteriota bacterium]|nr:hypothetical protein [Acidobacteriota bacterium]MDH3784372.1 hypothetical protein [Acidobacteriota bacterium]
MSPHRSTVIARSLRVGVCLLLLSVTPSMSLDLADTLSIDRCKTRIGLARVVLEVTGVKVLADRIEADYRIKIPLLPLLNDRGSLRIDLPGPLDEVIRDQVPLVGLGNSVEDGRQHRINAALRPGGQLEIQVDTGDRVLDFRTGYRLR